MKFFFSKCYSNLSET